MRSDVCNSNKAIVPKRAKKHMCGKCFTPYSTEGSKDCPNRKKRQHTSQMIAEARNEESESDRA